MLIWNLLTINFLGLLSGFQEIFMANLSTEKLILIFLWDYDEESEERKLREK